MVYMVVKKSLKTSRQFFKLCLQSANCLFLERKCRPGDKFRPGNRKNKLFEFKNISNFTRLVITVLTYSECGFEIKHQKNFKSKFIGDDNKCGELNMKFPFPYLDK